MRECGGVGGCSCKINVPGVGGLGDANMVKFDLLWRQPSPMLIVISSVNFEYILELITESDRKSAETVMFIIRICVKPQKKLNDCGRSVYNIFNH